MEMRPLFVEETPYQPPEIEPSDIVVEDVFRSRGSYRYQISYEDHPQFDPMRYELLPTNSHSQSYADSQLWNPEPYSTVDDDTVEILPARWEYGRSLMSKKRGKGKRGRKPITDSNRNVIKGS